MADTVYGQCTLCEAHCGIQVEIEGRRVTRITGDPDASYRAATSARRRRP